MAKFVAGAVFGLVVGVVVGAAAGIRATDEDEIALAASEAGVDELQLRGAMNSTGLSARAYLESVSELPPPRTSGPLTPPAASAVAVFDRLAACESTGNWSANTGNGYRGGLQMDMTFWRRFGGLAYASRPDLAPRTAQIAVAQRGLAVQGWSAWPACSRRLGLR